MTLFICLPENIRSSDGVVVTRHQSRPAKLEILQTECGIQSREAERYGRHEDASEWRELREQVGRLA